MSPFETTHSRVQILVLYRLPSKSYIYAGLSSNNRGDERHLVHAERHWKLCWNSQYRQSRKSSADGLVIGLSAVNWPTKRIQVWIDWRFYMFIDVAILTAKYGDGLNRAATRAAVFFIFAIMVWQVIERWSRFTWLIITKLCNWCRISSIYVHFWALPRWMARPRFILRNDVHIHTIYCITAASPAFATIG